MTHPLGREWLEEYRRREDPHMVPNSLPDRPALEGLTKDLPLQTEAYRDEKDLYIAVLQVRISLVLLHDNSAAGHLCRLGDDSGN